MKLYEYELESAKLQLELEYHCNALQRENCLIDEFEARLQRFLAVMPSVLARVNALKEAIPLVSSET